MQLAHDAALRATARGIYDTVYPGEPWTPVPFAEAERYGTVHYRQAVEAARQARAHPDGRPRGPAPADLTGRETERAPQ